MWLKIPEFCQISSFAGPKWLKISFLSQIFNLTQNICILSNFILLRSKVVKKSQFWIKIFWPDWKLLNFAKFQPSQEWGGQKTQFLSQIFNTTQIFWILSNFIFADLEWSKISFFNQIFNMTQIFWILSNFILCRFRVVKNVHFEANFHPDSKFLDFAEFYPSHVLSRQSVSFSKIFTATENFRILPNFILRRSLVVKKINFEPNFQPDSKYLHFAKFQPSQVQSGQK